MSLEWKTKTITDLHFNMQIIFPSNVILNISTIELQKSEESNYMIVSFI